MTEGMTSEQKEKLSTWAEQRDALLLEISNLRVASEKLQAKNKELADSNTSIIDNMNVVAGRIEELKIKEKEMIPAISKEVASLQLQKSRLEAEIPLLRTVIKDLTSQKDSLNVDLEAQLKHLDIARSGTVDLTKVIDTVTVVSNKNKERITTLVDELAISLAGMVSVNQKNVDATNLVIEKLPAMMMELQKAGLLKSREALIKVKA